MSKPSIAELLQASGYTTFTSALIQQASQVLYGNIGANLDARNWSSIMQGSNPLQAAEEMLLTQYQDSGYLLRNTLHLTQNGYVAAQAEITYRQMAERLGYTHDSAWSEGTPYAYLGSLSMDQLLALVPSPATPGPTFSVSDSAIISDDRDTSHSYSSADTITLKFSAAIDATKITINDLVVSNSHSFGAGATLTPATGTATDFVITLGTSPTLAPNDTIFIAKAKLFNSSGMTASADVVFTVPVDITKPEASDFTATLTTVGATSNEAGTLGLYNTADDTQIGSTVMFTSPAGLTGAITITAQSSMTSANLKIIDTAGNVATTMPTVILGTDEDNSSLHGTNNADFIYGFSGNDVITGGLGADVLVGGSGADVFSYAGNEAYATGMDKILDFQSGVDKVHVALTGAVLDASSFEQRNGTGSMDWTTKEAGNIFIDTWTGFSTDYAYIFAENSTGGTAEAIYIDMGNGGVTAADFIFTLSGTAGNDQLKGGAGADTITGGAGADTITGGVGSDTLTGGSGNDMFVYSVVTDWSTTENITDFGEVNAGVFTNVNTTEIALASFSMTPFLSGDTLLFNLSALQTMTGYVPFSYGYAGTDAFSTLRTDDLVVGAGASASLASAQFVHDTSSGILYFDADGTGSNAAVAVAAVGTVALPSTAILLVG
jgi:Ca2+-binding RTX toxin-like protein